MGANERIEWRESVREVKDGWQRRSKEEKEEGKTERDERMKKKKEKKILCIFYLIKDKNHLFLYLDDFLF